MKLNLNKAPFKLSGAYSLYEGSLVTERNKFELKIVHWNENEIHFKYFHSRHAGKPFEFTLSVHDVCINSGGPSKIDSGFDGINGCGFATTLAEARAQLQNAIKQFDKRFFYRKSELFPWG